MSLPESERFRTWKNGVPILMPMALLSLLRATTQPSLLERTTTGFPSSSGWKALSHETKKLLQSTRAYIGSGYLTFLMM